MNERQRLFCEYYIQTGGNATKSALQAGYSSRTAYSQGQRLLKNDEIKIAIGERMKSLEGELIAQSEEVLQYLTSVMRGEADEQVLATVGTGKGKVEPIIVTKKPSCRDRLKAAEMLARVYGLFAADKVNVQVNSSKMLIQILDDVWIDE